MTDKSLTLFCVVDGESVSNAFDIAIESAKTVSDFKMAIKHEKAPRFDDIAADKLILWRVSIPEDKQSSVVTITALDDKTELDKSWIPLSQLFRNDADYNTYTIVQRPPALKRNVEDGKVLSPAKSPRSRLLEMYSLRDAIEEAGLTGKAVKNGTYCLARLDSKDRVSVLDSMGQIVWKTDDFRTLLAAALELQGRNMDDVDTLSAPPDYDCFPLIETTNLYVRQAYKDLYGTILQMFENNRPNDSGFWKKIVVTGTSGTGTSAFLVYFAIRLLAEGDDDNNPPMLIFHTKQRDKCYVFGGRCTLRSGNIDDFMPFLKLPNTWYLVDSAPSPALERAKTIISAPPSTLASRVLRYQDVDKKVSWRYYLPPWNLEELKNCRNSVRAFRAVPLELMEELYSEIGGVPRYVLEWPRQVMGRCPNDLKVAKDTAHRHLNQALGYASDPTEMMRYCLQTGETLDASGHLIHLWPNDEKHSFPRLEWASPYVAKKVSSLLTEEVCNRMFWYLSVGPEESANKIMFQAYALHTLRKRGHTFELKDLDTGELSRLKLPRKSVINLFSTIVPVDHGNTLCMPSIRNDAGVDLLFAPGDLFQITVSRNHPVQGPPLLKLIENLIQEGEDWIHSPEEARLIFVVPSNIYDDFPKQSYLKSDEKVYRAVPAKLKGVKQYALRIDLKTAAAGKSLGL
ncbi:hypothetical protein BGZ83_001250 [Gryganskiella cystojenkinii]|nr:hypothetical protein BGZ83_001250 [Gryganskiella cystojenkinii]